MCREFARLLSAVLVLPLLAVCTTLAAPLVVLVGLSAPAVALDDALALDGLAHQVRLEAETGSMPGLSQAKAFGERSLMHDLYSNGGFKLTREPLLL